MRLYNPYPAFSNARKQNFFRSHIALNKNLFIDYKIARPKITPTHPQTIDRHHCLLSVDLFQ